MDETHDAFFVDKGLGGHSAEFEDLDFLAVLFEHAVLGVGQAGEGEFVDLEIGGELCGVFGADDENGRVALTKFIIVLAQLRHVRAAEGSLEAAVKDEEDVLFLFEVGEGGGVPVKIFQCEVGGRCVDTNFGHVVDSLQHK